MMPAVAAIPTRGMLAPTTSNPTLPRQVIGHRASEYFAPARGGLKTVRIAAANDQPARSGAHGDVEPMLSATSGLVLFFAFLLAAEDHVVADDVGRLISRPVQTTAARLGLAGLGGRLGLAGRRGGPVGPLLRQRNLPL